MHEYILFCPKKETEMMFEKVPYMTHYLLENDYQHPYDQMLYSCWCERLDEVDSLLKKTFQGRYDYRHEDTIHTLFNELTKEITIILTNSYHIILKCDRIPYVVIQTIKNYYPTLRIFIRNKDFEEVNYELD